MASVKNIKSKSKGWHGQAYSINGSAHRYNKRYFYRALAFADLPPAKELRPLRKITRWVQEAAESYSRAVFTLSQQGVDFVTITERTADEARTLQSRSYLLKFARKCADRGCGVLVRGCAASIPA